MKIHIQLMLILSLTLFLVSCNVGINNEKTTIKEDNDVEENRIIATTVAITEIMDALKIDLIGVPTSYKELPERYEGLPEVGNPMEPDMETILSLEPKTVMSVTTLKSDLDSIFEESNIDITYLNLESTDEMYKAITQLGEKYSRESEAQQIVKQFEEKKKEIQLKVENKKRPKVLILMGVPGSYLVATNQSYIGDLVSQVGGENVFVDEKREFISFNSEYVQQTNPDIILRAAHGLPEEVVEMFDKEFKENDIWKHFDAVKNNRVYDLEETLFGTTANLRADEALEELYNILYQE